MIKHKVWKPAVLPPRARTLSTKEVLKVRNDNSLKVRLTARGFMQRPNADYYETYSAVATHSTIRFVVALAAIFGLDLMTADKEQAYLQAVLVRSPANLLSRASMMIILKNLAAR